MRCPTSSPTSRWTRCSTAADSKISPRPTGPQRPRTLRNRATVLKLSGENAIRVPGGEFSRFDPFTIALRIKPPAHADRTVVMHRSRAWTDAGSQGWELLLEDGHPRFSLIHFWPGDAISIRGIEPLPAGASDR